MNTKTGLVFANKQDFRLKPTLTACLVAGLFLSASPVFAGQEIIIDTDFLSYIRGNGPAPTYNEGSGSLTDPSGNTVRVLDGVSIGDSVTGGLYLDGIPGFSDGRADNNTVIVSGGSLENGVYGGYVTSTSGPAGADNNTVIINGGSIKGQVIGGNALSQGGSALTSGNTVIVNGGSMGNGEDYFVAGGYAWSTSGSASARNNTVIFNGGSMAETVFGGYANSTSGPSSASGNRVTITGGTLKTIQGGYAYAGVGGVESATDNTVTISGKPNLTSSELWGGNVTRKGGGAKDAFTGNTLNVWNYQGGDVKNVRNFEHYNFVLTGDNRPALNVTDRVWLSEFNGDPSKRSRITGVDVVSTAPDFTGPLVLIHAKNG
ncbi:MAG: hypothetical protein LBL69_07080, partial [Zoogloeaceae bacterium]|nr:hypothetical protein [Zoogloeaceae bacterium]